MAFEVIAPTSAGTSTSASPSPGRGSAFGAATQHAEVAGDNLKAGALLTFFVLPFAGLDAAFDEDQRTLLKILLSNFSLFAPHDDLVPLGPLLALPVFVFVRLISGNGEICDGLAAAGVAGFGIAAQTADENNFIDGHERIPPSGSEDTMRGRKREIKAKTEIEPRELTIKRSQPNVPLRLAEWEDFTVDRKKATWLTVLAAALALLGAAKNSARAEHSPTGTDPFEGHGDVGNVLHAGSVEYDAAKRSYTIAGSGENMWFASDAFQFVWKKVSGDATLTADISFLGKGVNEHRKAVLMIRQSLDADSPYADAALHGSGLTSLQYREEKGAATHEIQTNISAPARLRIEKRGAYFSLWLADKKGEFYLASGSTRITLKAPFYVGMGVCSHDKDVVETAVFSNVDLKTAEPAAAAASTLYSTLEIITVASTDRRAIYVAAERFEAPNWMPDGKSLLFNRNGHIEKIPVTGGTPQTIDTGFATRCNNDHGISPDGTQLAISDQSQEEHRSLVYVVPIGGGAPRRITQKSPSYWHGWSPDGKTLAFVGQRNGDFDIYAIPASGGEETQLTTAKGLDDGPEYTPDGKYIYFNSERTGHMQIWRMRADGSEQEQVIFGQYNDWFPHISPDGQQLVFLTYDANVTGHPENKEVMLRLMSLKDKKITVLAKLFGGQGTMNVPSWSPDSRQLAFVSYQLWAKENTEK